MKSEISQSEFHFFLSLVYLPSLEGNHLEGGNSSLPLKRRTIVMFKYNLDNGLCIDTYGPNDVRNKIPEKLNDIITNHKNEYCEILTDKPVDFENFFRNRDVSDRGKFLAIQNDLHNYLYDDVHVSDIVDLKSVSTTCCPPFGAVVSPPRSWGYFFYCTLIPHNCIFKDNLVPQNNNTSNNEKGENKMNNGIGIDLGQIISLKMLSSITNNEEFDISKLMMLQSVTGGNSVKISDVMKAKLCAALLKDDQKVEDLPIEKLMLYNMFDSGNIDVNSIIQMKIASNLF